MLVLSRRANQRIMIGKDIFVTVVRTGNESIRLGIDAPKGMDIIRTELLKTDPANGETVSDAKDGAGIA